MKTLGQSEEEKQRLSVELDQLTAKLKETEGSVPEMIEKAKGPLAEEIAGLKKQLEEFEVLLVEQREQIEFKTKEAEYKHRKSSITDDIKECMSSVDADIVTYTDTHGGDWHANLIKPEPRLALVEDKLRENLGKLGKLDALLIARILLASKVPMPHEPYVRVYPPGTKNGD